MNAARSGSITCRSPVRREQFLKNIVPSEVEQDLVRCDGDGSLGKESRSYPELELSDVPARF